MQKTLSRGGNALDNLNSIPDKTEKRRNKRPDSSSIAGQIASHIQLERLGRYLLTDIASALFALLSWCFATESQTGMPIDIYARRSLSFTGGATFRETVQTAVYTFGDQTVGCGDFVLYLLYALAGVGAFQTVCWLISYIPEYFRAKRMLRPLNTIALTASELSDQAHRSNYIFDDIESAIGSIDPVSSDIHISTGNRDLKRLEKAINEMLDRMRNAYKSQSRFVSDASHELRTPIAVIKGYADMLNRWGKSDPQILDEGITAIKNESENMNRLVEQLLFLARGDNGRQPVNMTAFSLSEMMEEVFTEAEMIDADHEYELEIKDKIEITADISMMKQTARILCDNAKKYTPSGNKITLRVKKNEAGENCFEVQDTGIGIDENDIPNIFDRFFRSDPARSRETGGTGLGLSIAKWIVDRHNGHFEVISYKDIGTRITVCLPPQEAERPKVELKKQLP